MESYGKSRWHRIANDVQRGRRGRGSGHFLVLGCVEERVVTRCAVQAFCQTAPLPQRRVIKAVHTGGDPYVYYRGGYTRPRYHHTPGLSLWPVALPRHTCSVSSAEWRLQLQPRRPLLVAALLRIVRCMTWFQHAHRVSRTQRPAACTTHQAYACTGGGARTGVHLLAEGELLRDSPRAAYPVAVLHLPGGRCQVSKQRVCT